MYHYMLCVLLLFVFLNQPKDTQQALSRKESAVNMEKFKKFAARRKWKVSAFFRTVSYIHTLKLQTTQFQLPLT